MNSDVPNQDNTLTDPVSSLQRAKERNLALEDQRLGVMDRISSLLKEKEKLTEESENSADAFPCEPDSIDNDKKVNVRTPEETLNIATAPIGCEMKDVTDDLAEIKVGAPSQVRLLKARYAALEKNFKDMIAINAEKDQELTRMHNERNKLIASEKKLTVKCTSLQAKLSKTEKQRDTSEELNVQNKTQIREWAKKYKDLQKRFKQTGLDQRSKDVKLNRALEECERLRRLKLQSSNISASSAQADKINKLQDENRLLKKQKSQLVTAFKKQMKLIDILKRQKLQTQAMMTLDFTEKEFMRLLE